MKHSIVSNLSVITPMVLGTNSPLDYRWLLTHQYSLESLGVCTREQEQSLPVIARIVLSITVRNCSRVGEILALTSDKALSGDRVLISATKGSHSYMGFIPRLSEFVDHNFKGRKGIKLFNYDYSRLATVLRNAEIGIVRSGGRNRKRTHIGRYLLVDELENKGFLSYASDLLHHKSEDSLNYYIKNKGGKNG